MRKQLKYIYQGYGFYLMPLFITVAVITLFYKIDMPKLIEIDSIRRELSGIQERLSRLSAKRSLLTSLDEVKLKTEYEQTDLVLPDGKEAPSVLRNLEFSASTSGVFLENFSFAPGKLATEEGYQRKQNEVPLKVVISGTSSQITTFFRITTSVGRVVGLRNLEMAFKEGTASSRASLDLVAYFFLPPEIKFSVEEALPIWGNKESTALSKISEREILVPSPIITRTGKTDLFR